MSFQRRFKGAVAILGGPRCFQYGHRSTSEFVEYVIDGTETAAEFAAKIFEYWCIEGDKFNGYLSGVRLVIEFLAELDYEMTEQQLVDLRSITQSSPLTSALVESWVRVVTQ